MCLFDRRVRPCAARVNVKSFQDKSRIYLLSALTTSKSLTILLEPRSSGLCHSQNRTKAVNVSHKNLAVDLGGLP